MSKKAHKPYDKTTAALRSKRRGRPTIGLGAVKFRISVERGLLARADAYAKRSNIGRSQLIAEALELLLRAPARART